MVKAFSDVDIRIAPSEYMKKRLEEFLPYKFKVIRNFVPDVVGEAGPGGDFISKNHTVKNMRKEHYIPTLSDRLDREEWEKSGAKTTLARARATVRRILDSDVKEYLSPEIKAELKSEFPEIAV